MDFIASDHDFPLSFVAGAGCATLLLASGLAFVIMRSKANNKDSDKIDKVEETPELDKNIYPGGHVTIYYGSQTGTAESFAQEIQREGEANGFKMHVTDLEETEEEVLAVLRNEQTRDEEGKNRAIFLMATYGEGEPTDNAVAFIDFLKNTAGMAKQDPGDDFAEEKKGEQGDELATQFDALKGLEFAVFGLGNRQYEHFNAMSKFTNEALEKIGATRIAEIGLGDDDADLEGDFENWKDNVLWPSLKKKYISDSVSANSITKKSNLSDSLPECHYNVEFVEKVSKPDEISMDKVHLSSKNYFTAVDCPVTLKRELRNPSDGGSTLHLEIDISMAGGLSYQTADNLGVLPVNNASTVETVAKALNYDLDAVFKVHSAPEFESKYTVLFPNPCTVREFLSRYCDLTMAPRRSDLKQLAAYAKDATCKKALLRMSSKEGKAEYKEKVVDAHIGIADIVSRLCPSIEIPLEHFISVCPRLLPRYYTISSSSSVHPDSIHITVAVLESDRKDGTTFKGVCSSHLAEVVYDGTIRIFKRDSSFRLPSDPTRPIVMIGPGTGIAPMRALLQERSYMAQQRKLSVGPNVLYFGCKSRSQDYLYSDELADFKKDGTLSDLHLAFSREQAEKVYVQHILAKNGKETWELVDKQGAYIYVCGGVKMGSDVSETLRGIVSEFGGLSSDDSKTYLDKLASNGRFVQELWA